MKMETTNAGKKSGPSNLQARVNLSLRIQAGHPQPPASPRSALIRAYFRALRAAEMATWEMTGGDYVISRLAERAS